MKKIILVLAALILSANSSMAQTATPAANAVVADKKAEEIIRTPEIIEINKKIYQAKVANKPIDDLLKKKKEIILRIKAEREAAGAAVGKK